MEDTGNNVDRRLGFRQAKITGITKARETIARNKKQTQRDELEKIYGLGGLVIPEQQQHAVYERRTSHSGKPRAFNTGSTNLDYYKRKCFLSPEQYSAAMRLHADFYQSGQITGLKSCLDVVLGSSGSLPGLRLNFMVYERWRSAVMAIHPRYRKITIITCCYGEWLRDVKTTIKPHRRMDALQRGLDELVKHYEMQINPTRIMASFHASVTTTMGPPA